MYISYIQTLWYLGFKWKWIGIALIHFPKPPSLRYFSNKILHPATSSAYMTIYCCQCLEKISSPLSAYQYSDLSDYFNYINFHSISWYSFDLIKTSFQGVDSFLLAVLLASPRRFSWHFCSFNVYSAFNGRGCSTWWWSLASRFSPINQN